MQRRAILERRLLAKLIPVYRIIEYYTMPTFDVWPPFDLPLANAFHSFIPLETLYICSLLSV